MRYGTIPKGVKERLATLIGAVPYPMLDVLVGPLQSRALIAAERASVFKALGEEPSTTGALAKKLALDVSCLDLVLRLVSSLGYVERTAGKWSLSRLGKKHLGPTAPVPFGEFVAFGAPQWNWISQLDDVLKTGRGVEIHRSLVGPDWDLYQRAMAEGAREFAAFVARKLPVAKDARLCLDVAGSHGFVGAALCRAHPGLRCEVLERPEALAEARRLAAAERTLDVVTFRECDLLSDDYGNDADVVILANILHHFDVKTNRSILSRAKRSLRSGGSIGVFDIEAPRAEAPPEAGGDAAALFFRITSNGACFSGADYLEWLKAEGFEQARVMRSVRLPSRLLVVGRKP